MKNIIINYINKITIDDINSYLISNDIYLDNNELTFTYEFIKTKFINYLDALDTFNINDYQSFYQKSNFEKIKNLYEEVYQKYHYLVK